MKKSRLVCITPVENIPLIKDKLSESFEVTHLPDATEEDLISLNKVEKSETEFIFTNPNRTKIYLNQNIHKYFPNLKVICTASTGTVHIDEKYFLAHGVKILSLKPIIKKMDDVTSTAELAFCFLLNSIRNISSATTDVNEGNWDCEKFIGRQVSELTIGVIGYGRLGRAFTRYCNGMGGKIIVYDPFIKRLQDSDLLKIYESLQDLIKQSDVISLHASINKSSIKIINKNSLSDAKENLIILNTARGELVNEIDLAEFLYLNKDAKYCTDVLANETDRKNSDIFNYSKYQEIKERILITPHIGGMSNYSRKRAYNLAVDQLKEFIGK